MQNKQRRIEGIGTASKSQKTIEADGVDHFTSLPDNVINTIFSFLSMKDAFRTCISSKKLRHLLTSMPHLEFGLKGLFKYKLDGNKGAPVEIVDRFLEHRDGKIRSFRLALDPIRDHFDIDRWIILLSQNGVEELDLEIQDFHEQYKLPSCLFGFETIRVLKLQCCIFKPPQNFHGFRSVQTMVLGYMSLSDKVIKCILSNSMSLRILTLRSCNGFKKIDISSPHIRLERLTLKYCPTLTLNAPNLQTLHYYCYTVNLSLKGASNVANAILFRRELDIYDSLSDGEGRNLRNKLLQKLVHIQSLSLTGWSVKCLAKGNVPKSMRSTYWRLTKLELQVYLGTHRELKVLACLLRSCPILNELVLRIDNDLIPRDYWDPIDITMPYWRSIERNPQAFECLKNHLEWITISNFDEDGIEMEIARFFWGKTQQLKKMCLELDSSSVDWGRLTRLEMMPRASRVAILETKPSC